MAVVTATFILGANDAAPEVTILEGAVEAAIVELPTDPVSGTPGVPDALILSPLEVYLDGGYYLDYYFRIWVVPDEMIVALSEIGIPKPFKMFNAYPGGTNNTLNTVGFSGTSGLTVTPIATDVYTSLEEKDESMTAPAGTIDTLFTFTFDSGAGTLHIVSAPPLSTFVLDVEPMSPITEYWRFNTDIMVSEDATEQRVAIRQTPVHGIAYTGAVKSEADKRRIYKQLHQSIGKTTYVPYWQYNVKVTADAVIGAVDIFCVPDYADIRDGDYVLLTDSGMDNKYFVKVSTVLADRITLEDDLPINVDSGWFIFLTLPQVLSDSTGIRMSTVVGEMPVSAVDSLPRAVFERPGASPAFTTLDGFTVLTDPPLPGAEELFDTNKDVLVSPTGVSDIASTWEHPLTQGIRSWMIKRSLTTMDYWRGFFGGIKGRQGTFLLPTWHADMELDSIPADNYSFFTVDDEDGVYESEYFPFETYKRVMLQTDGGIFYRTVSSVADNGDGTYDINLAVAVPTGSDNRQINKISFLQLTRLDSDVVEWRHGTSSSVLSIIVRNVDA